MEGEEKQAYAPQIDRQKKTESKTEGHTSV